MLPSTRFFIFSASLLAAAGLAQAQTPRYPLGVYAKVDIKDALNNYPPCKHAAAIDIAWHACLQGLYGTLLKDPNVAAFPVAGLSVGVHWSWLSTSKYVYVNKPIDPGYEWIFNGNDWSWLDDAFMAVQAAGATQTVQIIITPGFDLPNWLKYGLTSCDPLFTHQGTASVDCGRVTFNKFPEQAHSDDSQLPLPWNDFYLAEWTTFLGELRDHIASVPGWTSRWVSIAIAGPSAASPELILPTDENTNPNRQISKATPDEMWRGLLQNSFSGLAGGSFLNNDKAIIQHLNQTIDAYETTFRDVTIVLGPDAANYLPELEADPSTFPPPTDNDLNDLFTLDCKTAPLVPMSCEAKTEVILHLKKATGPNAKATRVGGLKASSQLTTGDIGLPGVKLLTQGGDRATLASTPPLLGGAQFDHPVSATKSQMQSVGCPAGGGCRNLTPEEAAYNVLAAFFSGTTQYSFYGTSLEHSPRTGKQHTGVTGNSQVQFLDVPYADIVWAEENLCPDPNNLPKDFDAVPGLTKNSSLMDLLNHASYDLLTIAGKGPTTPPGTVCNRK